MKQTREVSITDVARSDDDVWATGTVAGLVDEAGAPRSYRTHVWWSHLVTLKDDEERRAYLADQVLQQAAPDLPQEPLGLTGTVAVPVPPHWATETGWEVADPPAESSGDAGATKETS